MFHYPLIPTITSPTLSPIQEETEELLMAVTPDLDLEQETPITSSRNEQRNNNTPLEPDSKEDCKPVPNAKSDGIVVQSASPTFQHDLSQPLRPYQTRSDTRRNLELLQKPETEVLKQKYINNDIRDIPNEFVQGPIRYGRIHRSRLQVNLASQDIRAQMTKLRIRAGYNKCLKTHFRCSRLEDSGQQPTGKTLEEILNGDGYTDDYDPELAKLFDDYVEECDQITRGDATLDTVVISRQHKQRRDLGYLKPSDVDTKEAFWRGFMEGMNHSKHTHDGETDDLDLAIQTKESQREATHDPCIDKSSHVNMIRTNQNVTHKFLKEWEDINSAKASDENDANSGTPKCFACTAEHHVIGDLLEKKADIKEQSETKGDNDDNKPAIQRDILPLGKTEINLAIEDVADGANLSDLDPKSLKDTLPTSQHNAKKMGFKLSPKSTRTGLGLNKATKEFKNKDKTLPKFRSTNGVLPAIPSKVAKTNEENKNVFNATEEQSGESNPPPRKPAKVKQAGSIKKTEDRTLTAGPFMTVAKDLASGNVRPSPKPGVASKDKATTKNDLPKDWLTRNEKAFDKLRTLKYALDDAALKEYQFTDENISIITLAKLKLENRSMSSLAFDSIMKSRNQSPRCRSEDLEPDKHHVMMKNALRDLDLDGWDAKTKPYCELDTLHMSSSELLHPVASCESFPSPNVWRPSCSTPLLTSLDKKFLMLKSNEQTPAGSRTMTPERSTSTSAKLSDLDDGTKPKRKYETSAFKPTNYVMKNKVTERVKLRLTKSCDSFVTRNGSYKDPAFANVPLARCHSYNIEQKMKSALPQATNINLSESLAQQLKDLGKDKDNSRRVTPRDNGASNLQRIIDKTIDDKTDQVEEANHPAKSLPNLDGKKLIATNIKASKDGAAEYISFPNIGNLDQDINIQSQAEKQKDTPMSGKQNLPPISCTSLLAPETQPPTKRVGAEVPAARMLHSDEEAELWLTRSLPCRTESLQSPYTFDKADPSKLLLKARALPHLHSVCTSCGGINERYENTSGHERAPPCGVSDRNKGKNVHHRCVMSSNDEKWKLEKHNTDAIQELPKISVSSVSDKTRPEVKKQSAIKKSLSSNDYSKYERTKKHKQDEMTFKFLDQNIKLRFDVDLPSEDKIKIMESFHGVSPRGQSNRLVDISKPQCRDRLECPIARETRIYKEKSRQKRLLKNGENASLDSPYIEYCKRKAYLQSIRDNSRQENYVDLNKDVGVSNQGETKSKRKQFPVIQAKTSKESLKRRGRTSRKDGKSGHAKGKSTPHEKNRLCVEPGKLPTVKQNIQSPRHHHKKQNTESKTSDKKRNETFSGMKGEKLPSIPDKRRVTVDLPDSRNCHVENETIEP